MEGEGDWVNSTTTGMQTPQARAVPAADVESGEDLDPEKHIVAAVDSGRHREAIEACARHYGESLGRLGMALLGSRTDAEEVAQEALLLAYRGWDGYARRGSVRAWLCGITRKLCLKRLAQHERQQRRMRLMLPDEQPAPDEVLLLQQRGLRARVALERIRPTDREALILRYVSELSYDDIARCCDIEEGAARKRVSRALLRLRELLNAVEEA